MKQKLYVEGREMVGSRFTTNEDKKDSHNL